MQETDMRIDARDHFAVKLKDETQHAMRGRMLRPKVDGEIAEILFVHDQTFGPAFSSPGNIG
jgi:hypothetical protein